MMAMYFVQHGLALDKKVNPDRPLSTDGCRQVECVADHLQKTGLKVKKVYHSGKTRASQTAQILADHLGDSRLDELSGMNPNDSVIEFAANLKEDDNMYVGHLPHLEKLVAYLVAGDEKAGVVKFTNGGVVALEKDEAGFHIAWYLTPSICASP